MVDLHRSNIHARNLGSKAAFFAIQLGVNCMQDVVEQVMRAYGLMVNLTPEEEQAARDRLEQFLKDKSDDTRKLAVEGVKFLRGNRISRARRA